MISDTSLNTQVLATNTDETYPLVGMAGLAAAPLAAGSGQGRSGDETDTGSVATALRQGCLLSIAQEVSGSRIINSGCVLSVAQRLFSQNSLSGCILAIAQQVYRPQGGCLCAIAQNVINKPRFAYMKGSATLDKQNYAVRAYLDGEEINPCRMLKSIQIHFVEEESPTATLYLKEPQGIVDLYQYYTRTITIYTQNSISSTLVFTGIIDLPQIDYSGRVRTLTATADRNNLVEQQGVEAIRKIGYWCESVFGKVKDYTSVNAELSDRLSTVPCSYDLDAAGVFWLTPWQPKTVADMELGDCDTYEAGMSLSMGSVSSLINQVEIELHQQFDRLFHRQISYVYHFNGYKNDDQYVHEIAWEGPGPTQDDVLSAAKDGGWCYGYFTNQGMPPSGWYGNTYFNSGKWHYEYVDSGSVDANGHPIMNVTQVGEEGENNLQYVTRASWQAMKRWKQAVDEKYIVTLSNTPSIQIHGEKKEKLSYTVKHDSEQSEKAKKWGDENKFMLPSGIKQPNGDYTTDIDQVLPEEYFKAYQCAVQIGYTKILSSHRQNTISVTAKYAAHIGLKNTVGLNLSRFAGLVKVREYTHNFDFVSKIGKTDIVGAFFSNPLSPSDELSSVGNPPERPILP